MSTTSDDKENGEFRAIIDRDRETRSKYKWKGNLLGYLDLVKKDPDIVKLAHARLYDMLRAKGIHEVDIEQDPRLLRIFKNQKLRTFGFFADRFFGMDNTLSAIVRYFHSASLKGEESRQVLYLVGPVGSG